MTATPTSVTTPPAGLVRAVEAHHGFGPIVVRKPLEGGCANDVFLVDSESGAFVLRVQHPPVVVESIAWEHRLVSELARTLPEIPAPVAGRDGKTFFLFGQFAVWLLPHVEGRPSDPNDPRDRVEAARVLGRLHAAAAEFKLPQRPAHPRLSDLPFPKVETLPEAFEPWRERLVHGRTEMINFVRTVDTTRRVTEGIVHGDFFPGNVLTNGERAIALLDWEEAHVDWVTYDLAQGVWDFANQDDALDADTAAEFIAAYRAAGGTAPEAEDDLLVPFIRVKRLLEVLRAPTDRYVDWDYQLRNLRAFANLG